MLQRQVELWMEVSVVKTFYEQSYNLNSTPRAPTNQGLLHSGETEELIAVLLAWRGDAVVTTDTFPQFISPEPGNLQH